MPSSRPCTIPLVLSLVRHVNPSTVLDVGIGFGKWGYLFREYTDIAASEHDPARYKKDAWRTQIEGIEAFEPYLHPAHEYIYDEVHIGNALEVLPSLGMYDVVFLGDVIEHFEMTDGKKLLKAAMEHNGTCVLVTTPRFETGQAELCENPLETHRSLWSESDFKELGDCRVYHADRRTLLAVYWRPGVEAFDPEWSLDVQAGLGRNFKRLARSVMNLLRK